MRKLLLACLLLFWSAPAVLAKEFKYLDVDYIGVKTAKFGCNREPMTPQYDRRCDDYLGRIAFELNLRILEVGYWDNYVHTEGVAAQVKTVGWHFEAGVHLLPQLDAFYEHHSRHVMEDKQPVAQNPRTGEWARQPYPLEDSYGLRFKFYINPKPNESLWR